ncbi:hypothetical protein [Rhizobium rhizogenes]|uniref:hypothetical protein n=1 Tax=Rhizobium rhizogenes TaxID=359 RepID=UPI0015718760|nr:hypothetical protein [Rhizobium rhizogenes]NTI33091.1 hypothetical protein [Rhizobium rhizogenes]WEO64801.1 hypothetical protein G6L54_017405 [Rhizobium rhizogenes]
MTSHMTSNLRAAMVAVSRRNLIAAASIAALAPSMAFADGRPGNLSENILLFGAARDHIKELWTFIDDTLDGDDCPAEHIIPQELGIDHRELGRPTMLYVPEHVDEYIDKKIRAAQMHVDMGIMPAAHRRRIEQLAADRDRAKEMLRERDVAYSAFKEKTGVAVAETQAEALGKLIDTLKADILGWKCRSLEDVQAKALFVVENWTWIGDDNVKDAVAGIVEGRAA